MSWARGSIHPVMIPPQYIHPWKYTIQAIPSQHDPRYDPLRPSSGSVWAPQVFQYFSSEKRPDGSTYMKPQDLLASLVAVYPSEASAVERSGSLPGERSAPHVSSANKQVGLQYLTECLGSRVQDLHI